MTSLSSDMLGPVIELHIGLMHQPTSQEGWEDLAGWMEDEYERICWSIIQATPWSQLEEALRRMRQEEWEDYINLRTHLGRPRGQLEFGGTQSSSCKPASQWAQPRGQSG